MKALAKGFASIVLMAVALGCSSSPAKGIDAAGTKDVGQTSDVGQARDVPPEVPANATLDPPTGVSFPEAPEIACSGDAARVPVPAVRVRRSELRWRRLRVLGLGRLLRQPDVREQQVRLREEVLQVRLELDLRGRRLPLQRNGLIEAIA